MPYKSASKVPENLKKKLPRHAQKIYSEAFNSAFDEYKEPGKRRGKESREETAHKVAWSAVKSKYRKGEDGEWHPKK